MPDLGSIVNVILGQFTGYLAHPGPTHDFAELAYVLKGRYDARLPDRMLHLNPGQAVYYPPGQEHDPRMRGDDLPLVYCLQWRWQPDFDPPQEVIVIDDANGRLQEILAWLWNLHSTDSPRHEQRANLLAVALRELLDVGRREDHLPADPLTRVHRYIHENIFSLWSMRDLAVIAGMSEAHLRRRFGARYGMPPVRLANELRRQRAVGLIRDTRLPLQEIARSCRYASAAHLSRVVKASTGLPPRELRAKT